MINKKTNIIAVDIDGVICDHIPYILNELTNKFQINITKEDITSWDIPINNTTLAKEINILYKNESFLLSMPLMKNAIDSINIMSQYVKIIIATSRKKSFIYSTKKWLRNYGLNYPLVMVENKSILDADVLIDDNLLFLKQFVKSNRKGILFDQPWNHKIDNETKQYFISGRIQRCKDWKEIEEKFIQSKSVVS